MVIVVDDTQVQKKEYKRSIILERKVLKVWRKFLAKKPDYSGNKAKA